MAFTIAAAVVAISAATGAEQVRLRRAQAFLEGLTSPRTGIILFRDDVHQKTPGALSHLSFPITAGDKDVCGRFYTAGDADEWSGRYAPRVYPATGTPIGIGIANDTLELEAIGSAHQAIARVEAVSEEEARRLDARVDSGDGSATGTVRWTTVASDGTVTVRWVIALPQGCNAAPTVAFTFVCTQLVCDFTDTSTDADGTLASWGWNFGDGNTATAQHPTHTYAAGGTYTVVLTVTDNEGAQGSSSQSLTVRNFTLTANARRQGPNRWADLTWAGALSTSVDVFRNDVFIVTTPNDGAHTDPLSGAGTYTYRVCEAGTSICSNNSTTTTN